MPKTKSQMESKNKWAKAHVTQVKLEFYDSNELDKCLLRHLNTKPSKQRYIKDLITLDMEKENQVKEK